MNLDAFKTSFAKLPLADVSLQPLQPPQTAVTPVEALAAAQAFLAQGKGPFQGWLCFADQLVLINSTAIDPNRLTAHGPLLAGELADTEAQQSLKLTYTGDLFVISLLQRTEKTAATAGHYLTEQTMLGTGPAIGKTLVYEIAWALDATAPLPSYQPIHTRFAGFKK